MKYHVVLGCLWMLVHHTASSPTKNEKVDTDLNDSEGDIELRTKRQLPDFGNLNPSVDAGRPERQILQGQDNQPQEPVNHFLTSGGQKDVASTLENLVTSLTNNTDLEHDNETLLDFTTIPTTTINIVSNEDLSETPSPDPDMATRTNLPSNTSSALTATTTPSPDAATTLFLPLDEESTLVPITPSVAESNGDVSTLPPFSDQTFTNALSDGLNLTSGSPQIHSLPDSFPTSLSSDSSTLLILPKSALSLSQSALPASSIPSQSSLSMILNLLNSTTADFSNMLTNGLTARTSSSENNAIETPAATPTTTLKTQFPVQEQDKRTPPQSREATSGTGSSAGSTGKSETETDSQQRPINFSSKNKADCEFGEDDDLNFCQWQNLVPSLGRWTVSKGLNFGQQGGPPIDNSLQDNQGGYALYETRKRLKTPFSGSLIPDSSRLISPILSRTDGIGQCIDFWYVMNGLSQDKLRILLRPPSPFLFGSEGHQDLSDEEFIQRMKASDGQGDIVLWEDRDSTNGNWINGQVVYSLNDRHMIIFEGLPTAIQEARRFYRGFISLDDLKFMDAALCKPFCNFEGGFCSWSQDNNDDFDWSLSRGSINPATGPLMDRFSFNYNDYGITGGGYAYIGSGFPRRPTDKARILSEIFAPPPPDSPLCMRFWTHMYGNGIGSLRIILVPTQGEEEIIWELKGEQGNNWYQGQVTISAVDDFQIVFEAEVGENNLGDIAIDEIALKENACPTSPQSASKYKVDCTFEVDECGWRNVEHRLRVDELDWEKTVASQVKAPSTDHTLKTAEGTFMTLPRNTVQRGERAWLVSNPLESTKVPLCLSFWYYMFDPLIESTGPSLGSLMVILMDQNEDNTQTMMPLWRLKNQQGPDWRYGQTSIKTSKTFMILFEGLWGNSKGGEFIALDDITLFTGDCTNMPEKSVVSFLDCDFTRDSCSYTNSSSGRNAQWIRSSISRRPGSLDDHTYGGPGGYVYFDVFSKNDDTPPKVTLLSRVIEATSSGEPFCLSFWYATSSDDRDGKLMVNREPADASANDAETPPEGSGLLVWSVRAAEVYSGRIEWMPAQVQIAANSDFKITFAGEAKVGGFAIDDIQIYPGTCRTRPASSELSSS